MGLLNFFNEMLNRNNELDQGFIRARNKAFGTLLSDLHLDNQNSVGNIYGAVVDMMISGKIASLICFIDGTTDLYYSQGHATTGMGQKYGDVRNTTQTFLQNADKTAGKLAFVKEFSLPKDDKMNIYLIGRMGVYKTSFEVARPSTQTENDKYLNTLIQNIITRIRIRMQRE